MAKLRKQRIFETTFSKYTATEQIGEGGTGIVFKATDETGQIVAVKLLDPAKATRERRRRFRNELLFGERNQHNNVITVRDHGVDVVGSVSSPFYVMPFFEKSLRDLMNDGITSDDVLPLFAQCLDGVEAAHLLNVTHRDLKPENILYDPSRKTLAVADFGVAEFAQEDLYTLVETKPGTRLANFLYAAPEQKKRGGKCAAATDIFALGLILNEMFTGEVALGTGYRTIASIAPSFAYLDELVSTMIRQDLSGRPASIDTLKRELIGRRNAFIERQELDRLKRTVVPVGATNDPILLDPIRVVAADWDNGVLTLTLSQPVNSEWAQVLQFGPYSRRSLMGAGPERFNIGGRTASIPVKSSDAQQVIDAFKEWLPSVHQIYDRQRRQEKEEREQRQRAELEREIKAREEREAIRGRLRV